jgi:hypothetical protein
MILSIHGHGASTPCPVQVADIAIPLADQSTALLILPDRLPLPDATALGDPEELQPGDPVSILYWEDTGHRLATLETTIARIESGVATVGDPDRLIGRGDSGSGVYDTQGRLVGNVWSIVAKSSGERLPWVVVGLLPAGIAQHIS